MVLSFVPFPHETVLFRMIFQAAYVIIHEYFLEEP
jgi:hypothetical protein